MNRGAWWAAVHGVAQNWTQLKQCMHWRRKRQPTLVFLPGESQGWRSLVGCRQWGCTELDTTEVLSSNSSSMYGCESWTIKKAEHQRLGAFELWCWERLLRVPWTAKRSNQSVLKEISPEYSLEGLMLKLKLQYFGHLMQRTDSLEKTLMLGKIEGRRRRGRQRMRWLDGVTDSMDRSW